MADDLIYDLANVTDALDDYLTIKEKNRNYIEAGRTSSYGSKGTNYNLKEFKYYDPNTEQQQTFLGTPLEARKILGSNYLPEKPKDDVYNQEDIGEIQQNLFSFYQKPGQKTLPVSINEAKLVMDIQNIMEDYADTRDDMILGGENVKNRLDEVVSIYDSYLSSRDQGNLNQGKVDFYRNKLDKTEARWSKAKDTKMDLKAKEEPFEAAEYVKETYGKDSVWYVHPKTGDKKIGPPNASIPGSPLEGYTPMGKITGDTIEDFIKSTGDPAFDIDQEALKGRDKKQFERYEYLMNHVMKEISVLPVINRDGEKVLINPFRILHMGDEEYREHMEKLNISDQVATENAMAFLGNVDNPQVKQFMDIMMPMKQFKELKKEWSWYLDPTKDAPDWYVKKYGQPEKKGIPEYISPYSFDPKLKSRNPLGLDIPEGLFK